MRLSKVLSKGAEGVGGLAAACIAMEQKYGAQNYRPIPVVLQRGLGVHVWDVDGKQYLDFLSAYSAVNQGHCHPKIIAALTEQAQKLTLTSRAFHNDVLGKFEKYMCELFGFDRMLPMNTGVEGGETAVKMVRKWAYEVKGVEPNKARVVFANNNFWGRTLTAISSSSDPESFTNYGPFMPGFQLVPYNDVNAIRDILQSHGHEIAAVMLEPIQGEAGVVVPDASYLQQVRQLCTEHNVLLILDEVQTGLGRTGSLLCSDNFNVRPDVLILGKALSGGVFPVSAVLAADEVMLTIRPGQHGSTYGGNPLGAHVAQTAVEVLLEEKMAENALVMGQRFREGLAAIDSPHITTIRGQGLLNAAVIEPINGKSAYDLCLHLRDHGLLAKQTHEHIVRLAPPLTISAQQIDQSLEMIQGALKDFGS